MINRKNKAIMFFYLCYLICISPICDTTCTGEVITNNNYVMVGIARYTLVVYIICFREFFSTRERIPMIVGYLVTWNTLLDVGIVAFHF